jgi:hypothetical protein
MRMQPRWRSPRKLASDQIISGTLSPYLNLSAGTHTFEIDVLRPFESGGSPYQDVTGADVDVNAVPEPGSLVVMGSGVLGLAGIRAVRLGSKLSFESV